MSTDTAPLDEKVLRRVQALMAKADATEFGPEADAFLAKATDLMTRFGIDRGLLEARPEKAEIVSQTVETTGAYLKARQALLCDIAKVNGVASARYARHQGRPSRVCLFGRQDAIETSLALYHLLDVQLYRAARRQPTEQRNSAAWGFARAVLDRLEETRRVVSDEAAGDLLPVLLSDFEQAKAERERLLGKLRKAPAARVRSAGYEAGKRAGRDADIGQARFDTGRRKAIGAGR